MHSRKMSADKRATIKQGLLQFLNRIQQEDQRQAPGELNHIARDWIRASFDPNDKRAYFEEYATLFKLRVVDMERQHVATSTSVMNTGIPLCSCDEHIRVCAHKRALVGATLYYLKHGG